MVVLGQILFRPINIIQASWDNCVKIANIYCNHNIMFCDICNQITLICGPDEVSIKSQTGPMSALHVLTTGYINWEYSGLVCIMFGNLIGCQPSCESKEERCVGNYLQLLSHQCKGPVVHWEQMSVC